MGPLSLLLKRLVSKYHAKPAQRQRVPEVSLADVNRIVHREFLPEQIDAAMDVLKQYEEQTNPREAARVQLAALKLAKGSVQKLQSHIEYAKRDYRDVLCAAEYPAYAKVGFRIRELPPKERERIIEQDWKQYEEWLRS